MQETRWKGEGARLGRSLEWACNVVWVVMYTPVRPDELGSDQEDEMATRDESLFVGLCEGGFAQAGKGVFGTHSGLDKAVRS